MIRKGNLVKNTAIALAIMSVFGSTLSSVSAAEIAKNTGIQAITVNAENKGITLETTLKHATEDKNSSFNSYLKSSKLKVVNGQKYMVMTLVEGNGMTLSGMYGIEGDKELKDETVTKYDEATKTWTVEFPVSSLDNLKFYSNYSMGTWSSKATARIVATEVGEITLKTTLKHETQDKNSAFNSYLKSSKLNVVNGQKYMVMTLVESDGMTLSGMYGIENGEKVETVTKYDEATKTWTVEFPVSSLDNLKFYSNYSMGTWSSKATARIESVYADTHSAGTPEPGTPEPGTPEPGTPEPGTPEPGTPEPGTPEPGTPEPGTVTKLNTKLMKDGNPTEASMSNLYLLSSEMVTEDDGTYMVMRFDNSDGYIVSIKGVKNDKEVETSNEFSKDNKVLTVKFKLSPNRAMDNSLLEDLKIKFTYNNPLFGPHTVYAIVKSTIGESTPGVPTPGVPTPGVPTPGGDDTTSGDDNLPQTGAAIGTTALLGLGGLLTASGVALRKRRK